jgi:hypothetical protein
MMVAGGPAKSGQHIAEPRHGPIQPIPRPQTTAGARRCHSASRPRPKPTEASRPRPKSDGPASRRGRFAARAEPARPWELKVLFARRSRLRSAPVVWVHAVARASVERWTKMPLHLRRVANYRRARAPNVSKLDRERPPFSPSGRGKRSRHGAGLAGAFVSVLLRRPPRLGVSGRRTGRQINIKLILSWRRVIRHGPRLARARRRGSCRWAGPPVCGWAAC